MPHYDIKIKEQETGWNWRWRDRIELDALVSYEPPRPNFNALARVTGHAFVQDGTIWIRCWRAITENQTIKTNIGEIAITSAETAAGKTAVNLPGSPPGVVKFRLVGAPSRELKEILGVETKGGNGMDATQLDKLNECIGEVAGIGIFSPPRPGDEVDVACDLIKAQAKKIKTLRLEVKRLHGERDALVHKIEGVRDLFGI